MTTDVRDDGATRAVDAGAAEIAGASQGEEGCGGSLRPAFRRKTGPARDGDRARRMRLALVYAVLDTSMHIRQDHLLAALALWDYCEASARYILGDALGDPIANELLRALGASGQRGMTRTSIRDLFARNRGTNQIVGVLRTLLEQNLIRCKQHNDTGGRPTEDWIANTTLATETTKEGHAGGIPSVSYLKLGKTAAAAELVTPSSTNTHQPAPRALEAIARMLDPRRGSDRWRQHSSLLR